MLQKHLEFIKDRTNAREIEFVTGLSGENAHEFRIKNKKLSIKIRNYQVTRKKST